jgi:hypothetical protein
MNGRQFNVDYGPELPGQPEFWRDETTYRMSVGFYLATAGLAAGMIVDKGCPLAVDYKAQTATPVKNVRINAAVASNGVNLKIDKGSLIKVGDFVSNGTTTAEVTAVDKTNTAYDTITVGTTLGALAIGAVLFEVAASDSQEPKNKATHLNYRRTHIDGTDAKITVTAVGRAYEIKNSLLPNPCSDADKASLGDRFMFID